MPSRILKKNTPIGIPAKANSSFFMIRFWVNMKSGNNYTMCLITPAVRFMKTLYFEKSKGVFT